MQKYENLVDLENPGPPANLGNLGNLENPIGRGKGKQAQSQGLRVSPSQGLPAARTKRLPFLRSSFRSSYSFTVVLKNKFPFYSVIKAARFPLFFPNGLFFFFFFFPTRGFKSNPRKKHEKHEH